MARNVTAHDLRDAVLERGEVVILVAHDAALGCQVYVAARYDEPGVATPLHRPTTDWDEADAYAASVRRR